MIHLYTLYDILYITERSAGVKEMNGRTKGRYHITVKKRDGTYETTYYQTEEEFGEALGSDFYPYIGDGYRELAHDSKSVLFEEWSYCVEGWVEE